MGTSEKPSQRRHLHGWHLIVVVGALSLLAGVLPAAAGQDADPAAAPAEGGADGGLMPAFAPDTDPGYAQEVLFSIFGEGGALSQPGPHWDPFFTALNNGGAGQGDSLELTWSIIPDGTSMPSQGAFDTACTSDLIATFNGVYGAAAWPAEIQRVWDEWAGKTGNVYTPAVPPNAAGVPIDDGAAWPSSPGVAGVRGDIRIGGCTIDGDFGILAFNFFPDNGDMKIESMDAFFSSGPLSPDFHNTFSHEHGHGAGLLHVCPTDGTKLMEPIITTGFTGMQPDDLLGAQRLYGDRFERINNPNDSQGSATSIGPVGGFSRSELSIDNGVETDWFRFGASVGDTIDVTVTPTGSTYLEGPDPISDLCGSASPVPFDSLTEQDLRFQIRNNSGVLRTVDSAFAGGAESTTFPVRSNGAFFVRVLGDGSDNVQMYDIDIERFPGPPNNHFPDAQPFTRVAQRVVADTTGARLQGGEPTPCGEIGSTVWYKFQPGATMDVVVNTFLADYDTVLAAYSGTSLSNLVPIVCNDDFNFPKNLRSKIAFKARVGKTYWIQAGGYAGATGELSVKIRSLTAFFCRGGRVNILGTAADDVLNGGPGFDRIRGFGGNDTVLGRGGNDKLCGDTGRDSLIGGPGKDRVDGGPGPDTCTGEIQFSC